MPLAVCTKCPTLIPIGTSRCAKHRIPTKPKPSSTKRGYGYAHKQERKRWTPIVNTGTIKCARCNTLIHIGQAWDLGHNDTDRTRYTGPEHESCNRGRRKRPQ